MFFGKVKLNLCTRPCFDREAKCNPEMGCEQVRICRTVIPVNLVKEINAGKQRKTILRWKQEQNKATQNKIAWHARYMYKYTLQSMNDASSKSCKNTTIRKSTKNKVTPNVQIFLLVSWIINFTHVWRKAFYGRLQARFFQFSVGVHYQTFP